MPNFLLILFISSTRVFLFFVLENDTKRKMAQNSPKESKTPAQKFPKKKRTHFSRVQLKYLEGVFSSQQYLTRSERALLANALGMKELQIRNWFQNRRYQLRHRRVNRAKQVSVRVLVSSSTAHAWNDYDKDTDK